METKKWTGADLENGPAATGDGGRNLPGTVGCVQSVPRDGETPSPGTTNLIEQMLQRPNLINAWKRVKQNKGSAGVDHRSIGQTEVLLKQHWAEIRDSIMDGSYVPVPVKEVLIPKLKGGFRSLGIPTVLDRFIQQAILQVLTPILDPGFSGSSYGFRPGRSARQAVLQSRAFVKEGYRWVVDIDLENFFDEVHHDILMSGLSRRIEDKAMLVLIRRYLRAGVLKGGLVSPKVKGTPQGGPLSPILSNVMLDIMDKELEKRGHKFVRYADDCNILVQSRRAGERVFRSIGVFISKRLRLKVNPAKSAVAPMSQRTFLGFSVTGEKRNPKLRVPGGVVARLRGKLKRLFRKGRGCNIESWVKYKLNPVLRGWINYFSIAETKQFAEHLDQWIRRRLRLILWRQWKRPGTRFRKLVSLGLSGERARASAFNGRGPWFNSGASHMNHALPGKFFTRIGLVSMLDVVCRTGLE